MGNLVGKTIKLELAGLNSNAFFYSAHSKSRRGESDGQLRKLPP